MKVLLLLCSGIRLRRSIGVEAMNVVVPFALPRAVSWRDRANTIAWWRSPVNLASFVRQICKRLVNILASRVMRSRPVVWFLES